MGNYVSLFVYIDHQVNPKIPLKNLQIIYSSHYISNQKPFLTVVLGDLNAKSTNWYEHDITTYQGYKTDAVTSRFGLQQLSKEPSHISENSFSGIDLIFTSNSNLVMELGVL